tara:strand:- start:934 stop:1314 length:381 start_codon:yes stop_codon:yes gene_type:complete
MTDPCKTAQEFFGASGRVTVRWTRNIWHQTIKRTWDLRNPEEAKRALKDGKDMMEAHSAWKKACAEWDAMSETDKNDWNGLFRYYARTAPAHIGRPINNDHDMVQRSAGCRRYNPVIAFKITRHRK